MSATPGRLSELATVLERMAGLYGELTVLANDKVAHMGKGDLAALRTDVAREEALVRKSQEQDGLRRQLLEIIGRGYGIAAQAARRMTASQLLQRLEPAKRWELELAVGRLRTAARELAEANR